MRNVQEKITKVLEELSLDGVLISNGYNMRYISGFSGATGYLFLSQKRNIILTDFRYTIQAQSESEGFDIIEVTGGDYSSVLKDLLDGENVKCLGFEDQDMLFASYSKLKEALIEIEMVPVGDRISTLRSIKTKEELEYIEKAESIGDIAFSKILDIIKPGMTELEVAAHLEFLMKTNGADGLSFDSIIASGINSSMPHATPSAKKIEIGDFVTMDFGCIYKGYCSDMTRTIVIGKASEEQKKVYNTVLEAQMASLEFIKEGYLGKEVDAVARNIIYKAGYEGCFGHGLGHSVGLEIHENPRLSPTEEGIILANMTETIEPGIYIKGFGGVRIEDLVAVTENGCVNYAHSTKHLIEL